MFGVGKQLGSRDFPVEVRVLRSCFSITSTSHQKQPSSLSRSSPVSGQQQSASRQQRPNSSQQPTRGRSLARRFRASFPRDAARRAVEREGRVRLSERTFGGP